jgi:tetratricopeptide (TPR) repeat protein
LEPVLKNNPQLLDLEKKCLANNSPECDSLLFFLKTWAVSLKYPDNIDPADLDETILANKLMYNFTANPALPPEVLDQNLKFLDEIISKNPSSYGAQKAKLIHLFAKEFQYNADVEEEFQNTLDSMESLKSDMEVIEMLLVKTFTTKNRSREKILEKINNFIEKYPQSPKGPYYRAALEWNLMQNPKETKNWLEKAKSLDPSDAVVLNSLENLKHAQPGEAIFYFTFHFDLEEV